MAIKSVPECDVCKTQKKDANRWFVVLMQGSGLLVLKWEDAEKAGLLHFSNIRHICGQACVHKMTDAFMSEGEVTTKKGEIESTTAS